jgi:hypothetical protein
VGGVSCGVEEKWLPLKRYGDTGKYKYRMLEVKPPTLMQGTAEKLLTSCGEIGESWERNSNMVEDG